MVGRDEHWMWVARVLGRSENTEHVAINAPLLFKKLVAAFNLAWVSLCFGMASVIGCHIVSLQNGPNRPVYAILARLRDLAIGRSAGAKWLASRLSKAGRHLPCGKSWHRQLLLFRRGLCSVRAWI